MKRLLILAVTLTSQVGAAFAGPPEVSKQVVAPPPAPPLSYFRANEWDLGIFATYAKGVGGDGDIKPLHTSRGALHRSILQYRGWAQEQLRAGQFWYQMGFLS